MFCSEFDFKMASIPWTTPIQRNKFPIGLIPFLPQTAKVIIKKIKLQSTTFLLRDKSPWVHCK